jgi:DNA-binding transcriptional LysR family regulator
VELRQLRYFVTVAQELHFGRAARRIHISGPALSQQILALEKDLGTRLFVRDRRSVQLTSAGRTLLDDARQILALADGAARRTRNRAVELSPLRLGYVSWVPDNIDALVGPAVPLRIDDWVLPSHMQADRVAEGSLDLALAWFATDDADRGLTAHLIRAEPLHALFPGASSSEPVPASEVTVLVDIDESAWSSWNRFAVEFATTVGARIAKTDDGGIVGEAFHAHVREINAPVLASPKRHRSATPPGLGRRPVIAPTPLWNWSLLHRADDDRSSIQHAAESLRAFAHSRHWTSPPAGHLWLPAEDPHRFSLQAHN